MRSPIRRRHAAIVALSVGILITAGCGGSGEGESAPGAGELFFQRAAAEGPDPFTSSTAVAPPSAGSAASPGPAARPSRRGSESGVDDGAARASRALPGSTPGLYGGTRSVAGCDVERQVRLLTEVPAKVRAFAQGAGITRTSVPGFLRELTPVTLRVDIRVTNHGYRAGSARSFQSVLQAGTAVMVDNRGLPRVRCACGSPLTPPVVAKGSVRHRGDPWPSYRPDRVVVIQRAPRILDSLVIVDTVNNAWLERGTGTDGDGDRPAGAPPAYGPEADITDPGVVKPPGQAMPEAPAGNARPSSPQESASPGDLGVLEGPDAQADLDAGLDGPLGGSLDGLPDAPADGPPAPDGEPILPDADGPADPSGAADEPAAPYDAPGGVPGDGAAGTGTLQG
ncbi:DUF6777 domain-containing protein [Streptomyces sp. NPDC088116]|uniref:DUF6777 domain-containing protein n=1 Tax=Streptomyces sp. NPDC088116 TaxID=3365825 RepID=UPI0037F76518